MADCTASPRRYTRLQIALHWMVAALLGFQLLVNAEVRAAFRDRVNEWGGFWPEEIGAALHLAVGLMVLALMILRLFVKIQVPDHAPPEQVPPWIHRLAMLAHLTLYVVVIGMALAGLAAWAFGSPIAATLHEAGRLILVVLILAHVAGALVEHHMLSNPVLHHITGQTEE